MKKIVQYIYRIIAMFKFKK